MTPIKLLLSLILTCVLFLSNSLADQVLVKIADSVVTEPQLEKAMLAATQFPSMDKKIKPICAETC